MILVTVLIVLILAMCVKVLLADKYPGVVDNILQSYAPAYGSSLNNTLPSYAPAYGSFSNNIMIDVAGLRENLGSASLGASINSEIGESLQYSSKEDDNGDNNEQGMGNFTNRIRQDPRYLEDTMNTKCQSPHVAGVTWEDVCLNQGCSGRVSGQNCDSLCSVNPGSGYIRTFGDTKLIYNDDMSDPAFKQVQLDDDQIYVPWSELYNNMSSANPYVR